MIWILIIDSFDVTKTLYWNNICGIYPLQQLLNLVPGFSTRFVCVNFHWMLHCCIYLKPRHALLFCGFQRWGNILNRWKGGPGLSPSGSRHCSACRRATTARTFASSTAIALTMALYTKHGLFGGETNKQLNRCDENSKKLKRKSSLCIILCYQQQSFSLYWVLLDKWTRQTDPTWTGCLMIKCLYQIDLVSLRKPPAMRKFLVVLKIVMNYEWIS